MDPHVARVVRFILRDPGACLRMEDLVQLAGYSRFHLTRLFAATTGESASQFSRRIRLERAAWHLKHTPISMSEASQQAGYSDESAFYKAVRKAYGARAIDLRRRPDLPWQIPAASNIHWPPPAMPQQGTA